MSDPGQRPHVLLLGDASARPYGLERALSRAGFQIHEASGPGEHPGTPDGPDAAVVTAQEADAALGTLLQGLNAAWGGQVPLVVVLAAPDREGPARALGLGADDAVAAPVHLAELVATGRLAPAIERTYPLAETADALRFIESEHPRGKIVLTVD